MLACDAHTGAVRTPVFDGPLELLLYLVRQQGVDLRDLDISPITDAYLAQIQIIESLNLDHAGDFLVLAATLCWLKSRELVPGPSALETEEEDDPEAIKDALARRLIEYRRYSEAADELAQRPWLNRDVFAPISAPVRGNERYVDPGVDSMGLLQVFHGVLQRAAAPPPVHEVHKATYSLEQMAGWLLGRLQTGPRELRELLDALPKAADRVVAFLASLELARLQMLDIQQTHHLGPVVLIGSVEPDRVEPDRVEPDRIDLNQLSGGA